MSLSKKKIVALKYLSIFVKGIDNFTNDVHFKILTLCNKISLHLYYAGNVNMF
jgi:hypothetical protein